MGLILFLLFVGVPLIEIGLFIKVGGLIGLWPTIAVVILTAALGAALWRRQGMAVMARAQEALNRGELPITEVMDGAFLLVAGALLLTPGFVTDLTGALLLMPPMRRFLGALVASHIVESGQFRVPTGGAGGAAFHSADQHRGFAGAANQPGTGQENHGSSDIIDVDFEEVYIKDPGIDSLIIDNADDDPDKTE